MRKIIISSTTLGLLTDTPDGPIWSTSIHASEKVICLHPHQAIEFIQTSIPKEHIDTIRIMPLDDWEHPFIHKHHQLLDPVEHLWMLKIIHAFAIGKINGSLSVATAIWRGTTKEFQANAHIENLNVWMNNTGMTNPQLFTEKEVHLIQEAAQHLVEAQATPTTQKNINNSQQVKQLIEQIQPNDHPLKMAATIEALRKHAGVENTLNQHIIPLPAKIH